MLGLEETFLLDAVKADQQATSERQHRDARRQHTLRQASLQLGVGKNADEVREFLSRQGLMLRPVKKAAVQYPQYGRTQ